jgi:CMP-N-acetylneuraminic acid synthetase|tara:strand:- start:875 stop:1600 length:726 start_codon:yes stop_codon:yes gene_type:complete
MEENRKILSIIPARAGSKGLPGKNVKLLHGKPLIFWTTEEAKKSKYLKKIILSTDDEEIVRVCKGHRVEVPFLRPKELARDDTPVIDVILHLLSHLRSAEDYLPDFVLLLQPTSPLRTCEDIDNVCDMLTTNKEANAVISITAVSQIPYSMRVLNAKNGYVESFITHNYKDYRRQDLPVVYIVNGALYMCKTEVLLKSQTFAPERTLGYKMPKERSVDIDDIVDFKLAETILSEKNILSKI